MADSIDMAQRREQEYLAISINNARARNTGPAAFFCGSCGESIPSERRNAVPGVQHCITCQEISELEGKHYSVGAL